MTPALGLPPGPPLPMWLQTLLWVFTPRRLFTWCERRYGSSYTLRLSFAGDVVCVSDADAIRAVFTGSADVFRAGDANRAIEVLLGPNAPMMIDGGRHRWLRRLVLARMRGPHLERYRRLLVDAALAELSGWPVGRPFRLLPHMQRIAADAVIALVAGDCQDDRRARLRRVIMRIARLGEHRSTLLPVLRMNLGPLSPWNYFLRLRDEMDEVLLEEIRARRAAPAAAAAAAEDLLSTLLGARDAEGEALTEAEVRDQAVNLLFAGYETSVVTLCWCFDLLLRHPDVLERLRSSIEAGDGSYLDAVVQEALRVRTVIYAVGRRLAAPAVVDGHLLPAGTVVAANIAQVHGCAGVHPRPERFDPDRFLAAPAQPYAWIPFGGGAHRCPGAAFATFEVKTVLAAILPRAVLRPASRRPERVALRAVSAAPGRGVRVILDGRA